MATLAVLGLLVAAPSASAADYPANFEETTLPFTGLQQPMALKFAPDGSVLVAEKGGKVKRFTNLETANGGQTVIDLGTQVHNFSDRGLLGLAVDPQFITNRRLYVLYTAEAGLPGTRTDPPGGSWNDNCPGGTTGPGATDRGCVVSARLSAVTLDALGVGTEAPLVQDWCQQFPSHSIGTVEVGPDGYLYAGAGDGASYNTVDFGQLGGGGRSLDPPLNPCGDPPGGTGTQLVTPTAEGGALRSQDVRTPDDATTLSGSIIRVDRFTGAPAPDNPLTGGDANRRRVIAHGVRNPFRFSFRPGTEELWLGDVGWSTYEEVNRIADVNDGVVENFGWPCYEGAAVQNRYMDDTTLNLCRSLRDSGPAPTAPIATYRHGQGAHATDACRTNAGSAIAGPRFYPGDGNYPARYDGGIFLADYSRQCIWFMPLGAGGQPDPGALENFGANLIAPVDLQIGPGGDLYYADAAGAVRRIRYTVGNRAPRAAITLQAPYDRTTSNAPPLTVDFDGRGSTDADGDVIAYAWDLDGDGAFDDSTAADPPARTYTAVGTVTVGLRTTDGLGGEDVATQVVSTDNTPPVPQITLEAGEPWSVGERIAFRGGATDAQDGAVPAARLRWVITQEHCVAEGQCHTHPVRELDGVAAGEFEGSDHPYPSFHRIALTATDAAGRSATTSIDVRPRESRLTVAGRAGAEVVPGLDVRLNGEDTDGGSRSLITNSRNQLFAPSPQRVGLDTFHFRAWSTGTTAPEWLDYAAAPGTTALFAEFDRAPRALSAPAVAGTAAVGQTLRADDGTWAGEPAPGLARSWQRCDANGGACADIPGASAATYTATPADVGHRVRVVVGAENRTPEPPAYAASQPSGVVAAAAGAGPGGPAAHAVLRLSGAERQRALRARAVKLLASCGPVACTVRASATLRLGGRRYRLSAPARRVAAGRRATLRLAVSARTRRALGSRLRRTRSVTLTVEARATADGGKRLAARRRVRLVR